VGDAGSPAGLCQHRLGGAPVGAARRAAALERGAAGDAGVCDSAPLVAAYRARFPEEGEPLVTPYAECAEVLAALRARGVRTAIATSREGTSTRRLLDLVGLGGFEFIASCESVDRGKPAPDLLELVLARTGVAPERTWMIGDTTFDVLMAKAAGVSVAAVTHGCHDRASLEAAGADPVWDDLRGLLSLVGGG
jgi:HAD superfamily hydrolase (TIGR01509 family)